MVDLLEKRMSVWTNENGNTVTITLDWPDAQMAVRLIDSAEQNYLESRYAQEVTALSESIGILQNHIEGSRADVDAAVAALKQVHSDKEQPERVSDGATATTVRTAAPSLPPPPAHIAEPVADAGQARLKASIEAKQRTLTDLEDFRSRRLTDLQGRLAEQQTIYTESHPAVVDLRQAIAAMSGESPQVKTLRADISAMKSEYERNASKAEPSSPEARSLTFFRPTTTAARATLQLPSEALRLGQDLREDRDPNVMHARGQLLDAMDKYAALRTHIQNAEIDLETAKAAFKYRYTVVTPAHVPKKPAKPNTLLITLASIFAAFFVAWVLAVVADLHGGRLVDRWQLERLLDRPIIADIELPQLMGPPE